MSQPPNYMKQTTGYDQGDFPSEYNPGTQAAHGAAHHSQVVISQPGQTFMVESSPVKWSWCSIVTAAFGFFCCQPFGLIALICALVSYSDHKAKDFGRSRNKRNMAYGFGIAAIVLGCIGILIVIISIAMTISAAVNINNRVANDCYGGVC